MIPINRQNRDRIGWSSGLFSGLTWGLDNALLRHVLLLAPFLTDPDLLIAGYFVCCLLHEVIGGISLSMLLGLKGRLKGFFRQLFTRDGMMIGAGALCGGPFAMTCYLMSLSHGGVAITAGVTALYPLIGMLLAVLILKERMLQRSWLGIMVAMLGIFYIGFHSDSPDDYASFEGILYAVGAAVGWAAEGIFCAYGMRHGKIDHTRAALIREFVSSIAFLLIVPFMIGNPGGVKWVIGEIFSDPEAWILLGVAAIIGMYSFYLWYRAIRLIGVGRSVCLNVTYSFWAVLFAALFFGVRMTANVYIGTLLVIAGVCLATIFRPIRKFLKGGVLNFKS